MNAARSLPGDEWTRRAVQRRKKGETGNMTVPPSGLCAAEQGAVHQPPVEVEPRRGVLVVPERVVRAELPRHRQARDEAVLLAVHRGVGAAVPRAPLALEEGKGVEQHDRMEHI